MNIRKFKWIFAFAGAIAVVLLLRGFAFTSCLIPSTGMENSLFQGERILVNKWSYGLRVPLMSLFSYHRWCERSVRQQDVVVFNNPAAIGQPTIDRREIYISRCIGTPGQEKALHLSRCQRAVDHFAYANPFHHQRRTDGK